jgi:hypothetical protein
MALIVVGSAFLGSDAVTARLLPAFHCIFNLFIGNAICQNRHSAHWFEDESSPGTG